MTRETEVPHRRRLPAWLRLPPWRKYWRAWMLLLAAIGLWAGAAWLLVDRYEDNLTESYLRRERVGAEHDLRLMTIGITQNWEVAEGVLSGLARQEEVVAGLKRSNSPIGGNSQAHYATDPQYLALSHAFYTIVGDLKIIGTLFALNARGDCIAASNAMIVTSPVGSNYADRNYFVEAMRGSRAGEIVFGRATNSAGIYLALPVRHEGALIGALVAKLDASTLAPWLNAADNFIADENGVVMLARDDDLMFKLMPGNRIDQISMTDRQALYKRASFNNLPVKSNLFDSHPEVVTVQDRAIPVMLVTMPLSIGNATAAVMHSLPRLTLIQRDQLRVYLAAVVTGALLQMVFFVILLPLRENLKKRRAAEQRVAFHQSMIDAAELAIAVFAEDGYCLTANDTMARLLGTPRALMPEHNFRRNELWIESGLVRTAEQVLEIGASQRGHWRLKSSFGQEMWVEATLKRFSNHSRHYLLVIFTDVTEQHWRDSALNEI